MARYRLTPRRRSSILKAQRIAARRKAGHPVITNMVVNMAANVVTLGVSGKISGFLYRNKQRQRMKRIHARKRIKGRR